jgi:hypothetical protein
MVVFGVINCQHSWCSIIRLLRWSYRRGLTRYLPSFRHQLYRPRTNWFARCNCLTSRCRQMWIQGRAVNIESKSSSMSVSWRINSLQGLLLRTIWSRISTRRFRKTSTVKKPLQPSNMTCLTRQVMCNGASKVNLASWTGRMVTKRGTCRSRRMRSLKFRKRSSLATGRKRTHTECYSCNSPIARETRQRTRVIIYKRSKR